MLAIDVRMAESRNFVKRRAFETASEFIDRSNGRSKRVLMLYGLRRTGKTVLMEQLANEYGIPCIYEVEPNDTMKDIKAVLNKEKEKGTRMVFLDEVTNARDFIMYSAALADYYAATGMDVVIAGTDSFGLNLAVENELFDRTKKIGMSHVSFAEHCEVLRVNDLYEYIKYGGLMREGMDAEAVVEDPVSARRYLDRAVADNIAKSLAKAPVSPDYDELRNYTQRDLRFAVNTMVHIYNGAFDANMLNCPRLRAMIDSPIADFLKRNSTSADERERLNEVDRASLANEFRDILNLNDRLSRPATAEMVLQMRDAMLEMGVLMPIETYIFRNETELPQKRMQYYVLQPAIKYYQLQEAAKLLWESGYTGGLLSEDKEKLVKQLENDIYGRVSENIVYFDTKEALDQEVYRVCKPIFRMENGGEYDLLIQNKENQTYYAFEIKHSTQPVILLDEKGEYKGGQDKNLVNQSFKEAADGFFGKQMVHCVLYNGEPLYAEPTGTFFLNMVDYLKSIDRTHSIEKTIEELTQGTPQKRERETVSC